MIVTCDFDHQAERWRFKIRDPDNDMIEFDSEYIYLCDEDADAAGFDAIKFSAHRKEMEEYQ